MRQFSRTAQLALGAIALAGLTACGTSRPLYDPAPVTTTYPSSSYPSSSYPQGQTDPNYVEYGRVTAVDVVRTQEQGRGTGAGAVIGGVAGGVVGNQIGSGTGRDVARIAGIVGGALAGNAIERNARTETREAYRVMLQMDNGARREYDVPATGDLRVGDRVRVQNNQIYRM
ncbi:MAG: glycine zipper 2TM domain-containing protein [Pseudomonadota bacterium]